jgi:PAS domain S-box-containing protein
VGSAVREALLILAPRGRDAEVIRQALERGSVKSLICENLPDLRSQLLIETVGGIILTEESLAGVGLEELLNGLARQPPWSDLPVIALATKQTGRRSQGSSDLLQRLGNVVILERPINAETLASAAQSALRGRRRQYQVETLLEEQRRSATQLKALNETLEQRVEERAGELSEARETLAFALDCAGMATWDFDLVRDTARRSARHDQIFGYETPLANWSTRQLIAHVLNEDRPIIETALEKAKTDGSFDAECRINRCDGRVRWIAVKGRVGYDADDRPFRMAGILMDVTERKQTEAALHQAQRMEAIGQLTGGVAHDFNNLLTVIVGGLDMIIRRPDQQQRVMNLAQAAMTAARRGEQLTQQLLAYSRRQMLRPETLNPNRLMLDFKRLAERAVGDSITLELNLDPDVHPVRVDAAQLESAVLNLVVNARDAMPKGGVILIESNNVFCDSEATAGKGVSPGAYVQLSVTDDGIGIDKDIVTRVFEPFFTTKEVGKGSGLGLAQVYGFIRSAGGFVAIESRKGKGTTVRLLLPRSNEQIAEHSATAAGQLPLRPASTGETVLLVEDDEQVLGMAVESLEELHYDVIVARDAREALEHLRGTTRIDIMFSDVVMPGGMNGSQLASEARTLRPELKVLLTSGYVGGAANDQVLEEDLPLLTKPYRRDELAEKLRLVLASQG